jgi:hydrogenase nickel incorporation protein HypA/HybF
MKTLEIEFGEKKLNTLSAIYLKIGLLSNIECRLLQNAFEAKHPYGSKFQNVKLCIESLPIKIQCSQCDHITEIKNYRFQCQKCNQPSKNLIQGQEMLIHKVEFD